MLDGGRVPRRGRPPPMEYRVVPLMTQETQSDVGAVSRDVARIEAMEA